MSDPIGEDDLQRYVDGRLNGDLRQRVEAYLDQHPDDSARIADYRDQRANLRRLHELDMADALPQRFDTAVLEAAQRQRRRRWALSAAAAIGWLAVGALFGWVGRTIDLHGTEPQLAQALPAPPAPVTDAITAHRTFVVENRHPVEVQASDRGHLTQWLSNRLGQPVIVPDLGSLGYTLIGGRLLPASGGPAAQFMYDLSNDANAKAKRVTLYVHPAPGRADMAATPLSYDGVNAVAWVANGTGFAVAADIPPASLMSLSDAVRNQSAPKK